ncbi:MAG: Inorganic triphosphatase [candidate division WS2 bacterium]|nr:Inorganic triphosphatase [Candidatus Psychracetigena formicireducens]
MIELEKTYLAKFVPMDLANCNYSEMMDVYFPVISPHPRLRLRKRGSILEMTKKTLVNPNDSSSQIEQTINLTQDEFDALVQIDGKRLKKVRYYLKQDNYTIEVDVFQDALAGLVLVDVEFDSVEEKDSFQMPDFCLVEVTQEDFVAGGMLCGKSYEDIKADLDRYGYTKL